MFIYSKQAIHRQVQTLAVSLLAFLFSSLCRKLSQSALGFESFLTLIVLPPHLMFYLILYLTERTRGQTNLCPRVSFR